MVIFLYKYIDKILLILLLIGYFYLAQSLILFEPQVWPDEAYIADVAGNILKEGRAGTDLWGDTIVGVKQLLSWYPPLYLNTLAFWFKFFDFSILNQRMLAIILGAAFLIALYFFTVNFYHEGSSRKKKFIGLSLILLLIFDNTFLKSSRMGRPEILVVLLGFLSLYFYQLAQKTNKNLFSILCGVLLGLTFLTHFIGIFFFVLIVTDMLFDQLPRHINSRFNSRFFHIISSFTLPVFLWFIWMLSNLSNFLIQLSLQSSFRSVVPSYIESVFRHASLEQKIVYIIYIFLSIVCLVTIFKNKQHFNLLLSLGLLGGWLICLFGKLEWYPIYIISFLYPYVIVNIFNDASKKRSILIAVLLLSLFFINVKIYFNYLSFYSDKKDAYFIFGQEVKNKIDAGKTIYLSTTPDLFFLLKGRNTLYEFPNVRPIEKEYINLLNDSDYAVINFHLEKIFVGNLAERYIELNKQNEYQIGAGNIYQAKIIELIPKNMRQSPKL